MTDEQKRLLTITWRVLLFLIILTIALRFAWSAQHRLIDTRSWVMDSMRWIFIWIIVFVVLVGIVIFALNYIGSKDLK